MPNIVFAFDKKSARTIDADGRMRVKNCVLSTAEINPYRGEEIPGFDGLGLKPMSVYELYRDPEEMRKSAASFEGIPLMIKHIPQTADEPRKEYQAGAVHSVTFDGKHLRGDLLVSDGYAIELIESDELSDLSCGYRYDPDMTAGSKDDHKYDGVMRNIQGNHVALVDDGRATGAHVADSAFRNPQLPDPSMQGDSKMAFPEQENQHEAAPAAEAAPGATPAPGAAPAGGMPQGEANEQSNMAAVGQALKHIAALLQNIHAKIGGGEMGGAGGDTAGADNEMEGGEGEEKPEGAMDFKLDPAVKGAITLAGAMDGEEDEMEGALDGGEYGEKQEGAYPIPKQAEQNGTPARGGKTPHGAMDRRSVKIAMDAAVANAIKSERARAADVERAKRDVRGVLGEVYGMDSARKIYREALKQIGMDVTSVAKGAERSAWEAYKAAAGAAAGARPQSEMAMDKKTIDANRSSVLGHLSRISVKG